jgi:hypothetical protein
MVRRSSELFNFQRTTGIRAVRKRDLPLTQRGRTRGSAHPNGRAYGSEMKDLGDAGPLSTHVWPTSTGGLLEILKQRGVQHDAARMEQLRLRLNPTHP